MKSLREKMLECLLIELFEMDQGIYPKSVVGSYKKRNDYQNGWNDAVIKRVDDEHELYETLGVMITDDGIKFL